MKWLASHRMVCTVLASLQLAVPMVHAQNAPGSTTGGSGSGSSGTSFDLSSTKATLTESVSKPVNISVGGSRLTVTSASLLTPAEYAAVNQVLAGGRQTLQISPQGNAIGGLINLTTQTSPIASLDVPRGVSAL